MARLSAEQRRAQAREVALAKLRGGTRYEDLTLREIAAELGIPLSTLTYAYVSISELLSDFDGVFHAALMTEVGPAGLRVELQRYLEGMYRALSGDPALSEINRFRLSQLGSGSQAINRVAGAELIAEIRRQAQENYRLPDDIIARLWADTMSGSYQHWLDQGPTQADTWYQTMRAMVDVLTLAADPQPVGQPHSPSPIPFPDYRALHPGQ